MNLEDRARRAAHDAQVDAEAKAKRDARDKAQKVRENVEAGKQAARRAVQDWTQAVGIRSYSLGALVERPAEPDRWEQEGSYYESEWGTRATRIPGRPHRLTARLSAEGTDLAVQYNLEAKPGGDPLAVLYRGQRFSTVEQLGWLVLRYEREQRARRIRVGLIVGGSLVGLVAVIVLGMWLLSG